MPPIRTRRQRRTEAELLMNQTSSSEPEHHQPPGPNHGDSVTGTGSAINSSPLPMWLTPPLVLEQPTHMLPNFGIDIASATALTACKAAKELVPPFDPLQAHIETCLLYTSPSPRDRTRSRMPSSA